MALHSCISSHLCPFQLKLIACLLSWLTGSTSCNLLGKWLSSSAVSMLPKASFHMFSNIERLIIFQVLMVLFLFLFHFFFWPCCTACGILVPHPGIEPRPLAVKMWSPNHWTSKEFLDSFFLNNSFSTLLPSCILL